MLRIRLNMQASLNKCQKSNAERVGMEYEGNFMNDFRTTKRAQAFSILAFAKTFSIVYGARRSTF